MPRQTQADPLHPVTGRGTLVPWLGHGQQRLLALLAAQGVTCTASPLHFMGHNPELALFANATPTRMGLVLDPLTLWRQLPRTHRGAAYRKEPGGDGPTFDPEVDVLSAGAMSELAEGTLDAQRAHGGTLLVTAYHLAGERSSQSRRLDLELARLGAEHFAAERMDQPALNAAVTIPRELYAAVAVQHDVVSHPGAVSALVDAYAALDVDGYYVRVEGFHDRTDRATLRGGGALLGALAETGRPVICVGAGSLHIALLVADISSCVGFGEAERFSMPDVSRPRPSGARLRNVYHSSFQRSFQDGGAPIRRAFAAAPCRCGRHPKDRPPERGELDEHVALVRIREAQDAASGSVEERHEWLRAATNLASHFAHDADVTVTSYATLKAMLDGIVSGRDKLGEAAG